MKTLSHLCSTLVLLFVCTSCILPGSNVPARLAVPSSPLTGERRTVREEAPSQPRETEGQKTETNRFTTMSPLAGQQLTVRKDTGETRFSETKKIQAAFDEMPLPDFIHHIFGDILKVNYVMDEKIPSLGKTVTLNLKEQVSERRLFRLVMDILQKENIFVFPEDNVFYVWMGSESKDVATGFGRAIADLPVTSGDIFQLIPIKYMIVNQLKNIIKDVVKGNFFAHPQESILVVRGTREQLEKVLRLVNLLDVPPMRGRNIIMIDLQYMTPSEFVKKVTPILREEGMEVCPAPGFAGLCFIELERSNRLLAFASSREWVERLEYWTTLLDVPDKAEEKRYFIFRPENAKATELADSLLNIAGLSSGTGKAGNKEGEPPAGKQAPAKTGDKIRGAFAVLKNFSAVADENQNLVIVYATPSNYKKVEDLLKQLDVIPGQVVIEVMVAEVTLTDKLQYGVEWYLKNTNSGGDEVLVQTLGGLGIGSGGLNYSTVVDSGKFQILLNALAQNDQVKILSSPRLTVREGKSAMINVGNDVPVLTNVTHAADISQQDNLFLQQSIQYRTTGITLTVKPTINARGVVTLEISQEVSDAQGNNLSTIDSPIFLTRNIQTEVVTGDGQTVVLGGLIKENRSQTITKVPVFGDIPFLGELFKTTSNSQDRTELVIMITPRILRSLNEFDELYDKILNDYEMLAPGN